MSALPTSARATRLTGTVMLGWFACASGVGAVLVFLLQPMFGRILLPLVGGAPAVWATCMVFFQVCLLAGYIYAHLLSRHVPVRIQPGVHALVVGAAFLTFPLARPAQVVATGQAFPVLQLLTMLLGAVGLPFFAVASTAPLIQRWFSRTTHADASDPYFLYAVSNGGSLAALLGYPVVVEPFLTVPQQTALWSRGYLVLVALEVGCAVWLLVCRRETDAAEPVKDQAVLSGLSSKKVARWLALAFVPSSLMLGVTTFATTDVAPVPLLWVIPLALYLLTFILCFVRRESHPGEPPALPGRRVEVDSGNQGVFPHSAVERHVADPPFPGRETGSDAASSGLCAGPLPGLHGRMVRAMPVAGLALAFITLLELARPFWIVLPIHFAAMFVIAMVCHGELARERPDPIHLTTYYVILSVGGALGGLFNALLAPALFTSVFEYPLVLMAALGLWAGLVPSGPAPLDWTEIAHAEPRGAQKRGRQGKRIWVEARVAVVVLVVATVAMAVVHKLNASWGLLLMSQVATAVCVVAYSVRGRPVRFALTVCALLLAPHLAIQGEHTLMSARSFFAVHRVTHDSSADRNVYVQGTTIHGLQSTRPERRRIAGAYFHRTGPAGEVLTRLHPRTLGLIGLGVGSLASYAEAGQSYTFYEIDPVVARIAENPEYFTFLADARRRGARVDVVLGDARLRLQEAEDERFDMVVLDAYSSDVVPAHLLTREALQLFLSKLAPDGYLLMNISNRYLDIGVVLAALTQEASLAAVDRTDLIDSEVDDQAAREDGKAPSRWILIARRARQIEWIGLGADWKPLKRTAVVAWRDDYVNLLSCLNWW